MERNGWKDGSVLTGGAGVECNDWKEVELVQYQQESNKSSTMDGEGGVVYKHPR